jgi:hypothetical protein
MKYKKSCEGKQLKKFLRLLNKNSNGDLPKDACQLALHQNS